MDWDKLRVFHAVAEAGSFTHAGEALNLSQSAISRQVSALEQDLGVTLFHRHARGLVLTEQGELLFSTTKDVFQKLALTQSMLTDSTERPRGVLKVTTTVALGSIWLTPRVKQFMELYPDVRLTLLLRDEEIDIGMREADLAIRLHAPTQPDLIQRRLMTMHTHVYAAPEYLKDHGMPQSLEDLANHTLIVYGEDTRPPTVHSQLADGRGAARQRDARGTCSRSTTSTASTGRCSPASGVAALPDYTVRQISNLVHILPELAGPAYECFLVYPAELRASKRVAVFRDFLLGQISETLF